jgi:hypothetical protein
MRVAVRADRSIVNPLDAVTGVHPTTYTPRCVAQRAERRSRGRNPSAGGRSARADHGTIESYVESLGVASALPYIRNALLEA